MIINIFHIVFNKGEHISTLDSTVCGKLIHLNICRIWYYIALKFTVFSSEKYYFPYNFGLKIPVVCDILSMTNLFGRHSMSIKSELLKALADGKYVSGAALAEGLGVSRNAVWKAVKALETEGFVIESSTAKGYRISPENNRLSAELIESGLKTEQIGRRLYVYDEVDSTNSIAKKFASEDAPHGTTVIADMQSAGRGRLGRSFISPSGKGIYVSILVRPTFSLEFASMITTAAAVAGAEAVETLSGHEVGVKWVNDLYMNGKKICGILTEASMGLEMQSLDYAIIGIGINIRSVGTSFDAELKKRASSIEDESGVKVDRNALCSKLLNRIEKYFATIEERGFLEEYRRRELLTGNMITANVGSESIKGVAEGIDDNANLIVRLENGELRHIGSGEANLCRIANN